METPKENQLQTLQQHFTSDQLEYSFGYGSGVFQQDGYSDKLPRPQVDMIHVVSDTFKFHEFNSLEHPDHYSSLLMLGIPAVNAVQRFGAGVYFNPYVSLKMDSASEVLVKYGVVSRETAFKDLREWSSLYIAGRLQKPVKHLLGDPELQSINQYNLESVFNLSLILISRTPGKQQVVEPRDFFHQIASISYLGDPRMLVGGENPNKVKNIVGRQLPQFKQLYKPALELALKKNYIHENNGVYSINISPTATAEIINNLPKNFKLKLMKLYSTKYRKQLQQNCKAEGLTKQELISKDADIDDPHISFISSISEDVNLKRYILATVSGIIAYPALTQSLKGVFTAGLSKSLKYAWEKRMKSFSK